MYICLICLLSLVVYLITQNILVGTVLLQSVTVTVFRTLIPSHKSPVVWCLMAQTSDDKNSSASPRLSIKC